MPRRFALLAVSVLVAGSAAVIASTPAQAIADVTSSNITSPHNGAHYMITNANNSPAPTVTVTGTTDGTTGNHVDIRCYNNLYSWGTGPTDVAVQGDGTFSATMLERAAYGRCTLRAVPSGLAGGSSLRSYTGPKVTTEFAVANKIATGPNAGKIYDYYVEYQSAHAMNDYCSASCGGPDDSRLQYSDDSTSFYLWYANAALYRSADNNTRSGLRVDNRNAYLPSAAQGLFSGSQNNSGVKAMTFSTSRNVHTGTTTIRSVEPAVRCPSETYPPTPGSCPKFVGTGVRLERTITTYDGGRQIRVSDVWRSTNHAGHVISAHYEQNVQGSDYAPPGSNTPIGLKLPWVSGAFKTFTSPQLFKGPGRAPASIFVQDDTTAPQGSLLFPRGAVSFDVAPSKVERSEYGQFTLRDDGLKIPASGSRLVRQVFVMGTSDAEVARKAAANRKAINPYRPDALLKLRSAHSYTGNRVYGTGGAKETVVAKRHAGSTTTFDIEVQNDGTTADSFKVKAPGNGAGYHVRYVSGATGGHTITSAVTHGTYRVGTLLPGQSRVIRLVVTVPSGANSGGSRSWLVLVTSGHDGSRRDAVKAAVHVV